LSVVYAVVLTFDRRDLLRACLEAIAHQTVSCEGVIVVDNGSSDGTADMLCAEFSSVEVCRLRNNIGAAAGFNLGIRLAVAAGADRVWVLDDDVIADPDALETLIDGLDFVERQGKEPPFVISVARSPGGVLTNVPERIAGFVRRHYPSKCCQPSISASSLTTRHGAKEDLFTSIAVSKIKSETTVLEGRCRGTEVLIGSRS
jgi:glycosyltransferase involved in cell wall biosynthesis